MKAIIMAGGEGSRLRPLTAGMPKPLTKLCNRPTVEYILDLLAEHNCEEATFTLRYKGEMIEKHFEEHYYKGIKLNFAYEKEPLGTAGCVKNAASDFSDELLIISGDALCDFDLAEVLRFHKEKNADATIIAKRVDDPREYGLVIEREGRITGFSEKPSYLNCISDYANTGIYVITKKVADMIPDGKMWDFAKDVFPEMIERNMGLYTYKAEGYWCDVGDLTTYRESQFDMLSGTVKCSLKGAHVKEGVYSESPLPDNITIIPPCYIGRNVNIGENSVLEKSVLCDNVTVGKNVRIYGSVLLDGAFLSGEVFCESAIICENVKAGEHSVIREECVIGENTVLGEKSEIKPGVKIWRDKNIKAFSAISSDIKHSAPPKPEIGEGGISGAANIDIDMETAVKIGSGAATLSENGILLASEGNASSIAIKHAIQAGISAGGGNVSDCGFSTLPALIYLSGITGCDLIIHVSGKSRTNVVILNKYGLSLTRSQERILEGGLIRREYKTASWYEFGKIVNLKNCEPLYLHSLTRIGGKKTAYNIFLSCKNEAILSYSQSVFDEISDRAGEDLVINISSDGSEADFHLSRNEVSLKASHEKLILLACLMQFKNGKDVALPASFPVAADILAAEFNRRVYRFFACSNDYADKAARQLSEKQPFLRDGVYLALFVLNGITEEKITLEEALALLPDFSRERRIIRINCPPQRILSDFCENASGIGEGILLTRDSGKVLLRSGKKGDSLFLFAESASAETAAALCDDIEKRIKAYKSE